MCVLEVDVVGVIDVDAQGQVAKKTIDRLSDRRVRTAGPGMHSDGLGLYLRVTTGSGGVLNRYWIFRFADRVTGKDRQLGLGPLHTIGLAQARELAREAREQLLRGTDPIAAKHAQHASQAVADASVMTFDACRDAYVAAHRPSWSSKKHLEQWTVSLASYASPILGHLPVSAITDALILRVLEPHWTTKTETMSRIRGRLENILDWARVRGYRSGENPARWRGHLDHLLPAKSKMKKGRKAHHAALPYERIGELMADLRSRPGVGARAFEFLILTAARTEEVLGARWSEIDWTSSTWTVPAERMKARQEHRVPLSEPTMSILAAMKTVSGGTGHIFPGRRAERPLGDMTFLDLITDMNADRAAAGLDRYTDPHQGGRVATVHGFRSTMRQWAAERTAYPREVCERALAHSTETDVEKAYQRSDFFDQRRRLMADWATFAGMPSVTTGDVVPLQRKA
jgi:integrase